MTVFSWKLHYGQAHYKEVEIYAFCRNDTFYPGKAVKKQ